MGAFAVQLADLRHVVTHLHGLAEDLGHIKGFAPSYGGQTGDHGLESAINHFFAEWSQGLNTTRHNLDGLATALGQAEQQYQQAESVIAAACGGGS